jgi:hypothetical protein
MAKRNAAIHAARALIAQALLFHVVMEFVPILHALRRGAIHRQFAEILDKSCWLAHFLNFVRDS